MSFRLSERSLSNLQGVDEQLVATVKLAILNTKIDFGVICGLRTIEEQRVLVDKGASKTMRSKHLDGNAVDLMAYIGSRGSWERSRSPGCHRLWAGACWSRPSIWIATWSPTPHFGSSSRRVVMRSNRCGTHPCGNASSSLWTAVGRPVRAAGLRATTHRVRRTTRSSVSVGSRPTPTRVGSEKDCRRMRSGSRLPRGRL